MKLDSVASYILVIWFVLSSLVTTAALSISVWVLFQFNKKLTPALEKIQPLMEKADHLLVTAGDKLESISAKTETILVQGKDIADEVHEKVDRTASTVQRTVNAPIVHSNSLLMGVQQGLATFVRLQRGERQPTSLVDNALKTQIQTVEDVHFNGAREAGLQEAIPARKEH